MADEPTNLDIYFKSGNKITLRVTDFTVVRGALQGDIRKFSWTHPEADVESVAQTLPYIDLSAVEAIVERPGDE